MANPKDKAVYKLRIDREFQNLIRPLFKGEYMQLEANLIADGCRTPISVWNGVIVDGHNRYKICTAHQIPFAVEEMSFSCREEVIVWICANQLGRRNITEESRKFLIGKQYESEKLLNRRRAASGETEGGAAGKGPSAETHDQRQRPRGNDTRLKTAERIAMENRISHGTVEKYAIYSRAIEEIENKSPQMAGKILSGKYKLSHESVISLAKRSAKDIQELNSRLEKTESPFATFQTTRQEIRNIDRSPKESGENRPSVKDMPQFDPDAEVIGLALTIPSWKDSVDRIFNSNLDIITVSARQKLRNALLDLQYSVSLMLSAIKEDH